MNKIIELCQRYMVSELYIFGSILTTEFNPESDIDLVVKIDKNDPLEYAENYFNLKFNLESLFKRKIDLLEDESISNRTFRSLVNNQKVKIYDRQGKSVA